MHLKTDFSVHYKTIILNPDGTVFKERDFKKNLILDSGLDMINGNPYVNCFTSCALGTGTKPVKRDSGTTTFTRAGSIVTASANFFEAADVGRILKFDSGEEMRITVFTSATQVTVSISGALAASEGTIWYVNETVHQTETKRANTYTSVAGDNQTTFSIDTLTHQRTFLFSAEAAPVTYREIGWSNSNVANAALFGRDLIPGIGDSLSAGQQYKVIVRLSVKLSPSIATVQTDIGNNGFNTTGTYKFEYIGGSFSTIASNGSSTVPGLGRYFEPAATDTAMSYITGAFSLIAGISNTSTSTNANFNAVCSKSSYTNGSFFVDKTCTIPVNAGNFSNIQGFSWGVFENPSNSRCFTLRFDNQQTKANTHTLTATLRQSWGRILTN